MYHRWGCTSISPPFQYPFKSLKINSPMINVQLSNPFKKFISLSCIRILYIHCENCHDLSEDGEKPEESPGGGGADEEESRAFECNICFDTAKV